MTRCCWICGEIADSSEHKIKKSDLIRIHGSSDQFRKSKIYYLTSSRNLVRHRKLVQLQGPDSSRVKYNNTLCAKCNNERTQKADFAYVKFQEYASRHKTDILGRKYIFLDDIYGSSFLDESLELFRYFTKSIGCCIADAGELVPKDLSDVMLRKTFQTSLWVCVAINEDELYAQHSTRLATGNLICIPTESGHKKFAFAYFCEWLVFTMWYGLPPLGPVGGRWAADLNALCLGSYSRAISSFEIPLPDGSVMAWPSFES